MAMEQWQCSAVGKVTESLASHWTFVTDCGISTYGLNGLRMRDEHAVYTVAMQGGSTTGEKE